MNTKYYAAILLLILSSSLMQGTDSLKTFTEDIVYTPIVTGDKVIHPINSVKRPLKTVGDIVPFQTYEDYRSDYEYRK